MSKKPQRSRRSPAGVTLRRLTTFNAIVALVTAVASIFVPSVCAFLIHQEISLLGFFGVNTNANSVTQFADLFVSVFITLAALEMGYFMVLLAASVCLGKDMLTGVVYFIAGMKKPHDPSRDVEY